MIDLNNRRMHVIETAVNGVVNHQTIFVFNQTKQRVYARYAGGEVARGMLIGRLIGSCLKFDFVQIHKDGQIAGGKSRCDIIEADNKLTMVETFDWDNGVGRNIFAEVD